MSPFDEVKMARLSSEASPQPCAGLCREFAPAEQTRPLHTHFNLYYIFLEEKEKLPIPEKLKAYKELPSFPHGPNI